MSNHGINTVVAEIAAGSQGLLQFYVTRHSDYAHLAGRAEEGDHEAFVVCALMSAVGQGMSASGDVQPCLLCENVTGFGGSGGLAIVGPSPFQRGDKCVFRLLCGPCCAMSDADLMRAVTDRWRAVVTPTLRVLPPIHETAGRA